ncbi:hypothetical protein Tco_1253468, partial [Tanacetum coccineum]
EDYQEYGLPIIETLLTEAIKQFESYKMFIKYSIGQIQPKKSRAKKKTSSKRRVKMKVTLSADDNIISDDPDAALELAKSTSKTKAEEAKEARQVHATHARIVTEYVLKSAKKKYGGRSSKSVVIQDTPNDPKSKPATLKTKLKGALSLTPEEQEVAGIMQALKESKKTSRRQLGTTGSNEGTSSKLGVPDESTVISNTSSKGTGIKPRVPDDEKDITKEKVILELGDEQDSEYSDDDNNDVEKDDKDGDADDEGNDHISDTQDVDDEDVKTESDEDDIYKYKIRVCKDEDEEMINDEVDDSNKGDEEITGAVKADVEKTSEVKDDPKKAELLHQALAYLYLQVLVINSLNFLLILIWLVLLRTPQIQRSTHYWKLRSSLKFHIPTTITILPPPSVSTTPPVPQQTTTLILTQPITTDAPTITIVVPESNALTAVELRVAKLEKDVSELKTIDHSTEALAILKSQVLSVVDNYLGSKVGDKQTPTVDLEQGSEKSASEILKIKREQAEKQQKPKFTIKSTDKAVLKEYDLKSALYQSMHANKSFNRNPANHRLYHELIEALIEDENAMDKGVADIGNKTKRRRTKESESSKKPSSTKETPKGKAPTKGSKTSKSASAKEPVEEPISKVVMNDAGDDVACDDNKPQDTSEPKTRKTLNPDWFKQPPRPSTPDPEWKKH